MKTSSFFLFLIFPSTAAVSAQAQQRQPSEAATAEQRLVEDLGTERLPTVFAIDGGRSVLNASALQQTGISNMATINQQSLSTQVNQAFVVQAGAANVLGLSQTGGGNNAYLGQQGTGNRLDLSQNGQQNTSTITQKGASNQFKGIVDGDRNTLNINQDGINNQVHSEIHQDGRNYTINQTGYNNTLTQLEQTTRATSGYSVEMRGTGINLTIEQGKVH